MPTFCDPVNKKEVNIMEPELKEEAKEEEGVQTEEEKALVPKPPLVVGDPSGGLIPTNIDELWRMADWFFKSGVMPDSLKTPEAVAVAIQLGLEVGLKPMQACQNIAVINKRATVWGDAALALIFSSGKMKDFKEIESGSRGTNEWGYTCVAVRKGISEPFVGTFTYKEAREAGLAPGEPKSAWKKYPKRMLQMRARGFALRDGFPDVLKGLYLREEVMDLEPDASGTYSVADKTNEKLQKLKDRIDKANDTPLYDEGKAKQTKGYHPWFMENIDRIRATNETDQGLCLKKYADLYPDNDLPTLEEPEAEAGPIEDKAESSEKSETEVLIEKMETLDWQSLGKLICPKNDQEVIAVACKSCDSRVVITEAEGKEDTVEVCPELLEKLEKPKQGELLE
jgi:hypothetical protein